MHYDNYLDNILRISKKYLQKEFNEEEIDELISRIKYIQNIKDRDKIIEEFIDTYCRFVKEKYQKEYKNRDKRLIKFIDDERHNLKLIWGDAYKVLKSMDSESIHLMITSPPYYNARSYSNWDNLNDYFNDMKQIIYESYRVLDNHRVFVFNVGDIFDNDNIKTKSVWGKRRIPLGAYYINIFEDVGFTFVNDFIWDKGEVQSERNKNGKKP